MSHTEAHQIRDFTPAIPFSLGIYDPIIATLTREKYWRGELLRQLSVQRGDVIADVGCGTGSFLRQLGRQGRGVRLIGIDPDASILMRAGKKLKTAGVAADLQQGYLRDTDTLLVGSGVNKIVSSLVFHQVPMSEKRAGLAALFEALGPGGELHIADYGLQRTPLMRRLFRIVQHVDGFADTQPNADGILPELMREAGFVDVEETAVVPTVTGSISLYRGRWPCW